MTKFILELFKRFASKTPWFFKVIQIISVIITVIMLGPDIMEAIEKGGFELPSTWKQVITKAVGIATFIGGIIAQLAVTTEEKQEKNIPE